MLPAWQAAVAVKGMTDAKLATTIVASGTPWIPPEPFLIQLVDVTV